MPKEPTFSASPEFAAEFRQIEHGSAEYERVLDLRRRVLREPLGLVFTAAQIQAESGDTHLAAFDSAGKVVACAVLTRESPEIAHMRQVAVEPEVQNRGLGSRMLEFAEEIARKRGARLLFCHARHHVVGFYAKRGYTAVGEPFVEVGMEHRRMERELS